MSAMAYRCTCTPGDAGNVGTHRYLLHTPAFTVVIGMSIGMLCLGPPARAVTVWLLLCLALRGLGRLPRAGKVRDAPTGWLAMARGGNGFLRLLPHQARDALGGWFSLSLLAVALTYLLLHSGVHTRAYVGAAVALGMVTHILGDAIPQRPFRRPGPCR
ncbi:hypothetical protein ACFO4E_18350 [Nocardiopsis mangrovi]|uniref:Metal-dependent hydrolase n=1 Tax=Nocardiopsis mangrovi TaxID=1179818 RepID=A0ABV9E0D0_9ACTN